MRIKLFLSIVLVCSFSVQAQVPKNKRVVAAKQIETTQTNKSISNTLPIKRVIVYSNGVAYIERRGFVSGNAEVNLSFKQSQVDDVLKSMVVLDLGQGRIGAVSYNSSQPVTARTAEIPFSVESKSENSEEGEGGLAEVLAQLQGAKVFVTSTKGTTTGAILTVEKRKIVSKNKDEEETSLPVNYALVIASEAGEISSFELNEIRSVKLLDEDAKRDLNEFSNATASARRRDAKTITVTSEGIGQREMIVSYTIAAPIWKTTYRVVLDEQGKPFFQGWAIVDNVSDEDWTNIQLSLVSGTPISFIQPIQKPLYRYRPIVPIPEDLNLQPQIYDPESGSSDGYGEGNGSGSGSGSGTGNGNAPPPPPPPAKSEFESANNNFIVSSGFKDTGVSDALINEKSGVQTAASGSEIGDLFEYKIEQPVTISRNRSALIPIVQTKMEGERVSIFREDTENNQPRPMSGLLLKNITAMTFEGGSMTVLDHDAYAGEALMERLKPKEQRLISFALDLGTLVTIEKKEDREPARLVKAVKGIFEIHYFRTDKKIYKINNQTDRAKTIYIEHPVRENWILANSSAKPDFTTARFYRFRLELKPFETKEIVVAENQGMKDSYTLSTLSPKDVELFVSQKYIDETTRAKLSKLIDLRMQINQINAKLASFDTEIEEITTDQARFRENIEALAKTPEAKQLIARYIAKANEQESRLEQINKERQTLAAEKERLERELAIEIKNFEIQPNAE
ncbi:MAG: hypothetical protein ACR2MG_04675 [Pyrinomonadaceae bacterium]